MFSTQRRILSAFLMLVLSVLCCESPAWGQSYRGADTGSGFKYYPGASRSIYSPNSRYSYDRSRFNSRSFGQSYYPRRYAPSYSDRYGTSDSYYSNPNTYFRSAYQNRLWYLPNSGYGNVYTPYYAYPPAYSYYRPYPYFRSGFFLTPYSLGFYYPF